MGRLRLVRSRVLVAACVALLPLVALAGRLLPRLANNFAFFVRKPRAPEDLQPWLRPAEGGVALDRAWLEARYRKPAS